MELEKTIARDLQLHEKYEKIDKKLERNLRFLKWRQKNVCKKNDQMCAKNCKTIISVQPSYLENCAKFKIMENIDPSLFNYNKTSPDIIIQQAEQAPPNIKEQEKIHVPFTSEIKTLQNNFKNNAGDKFVKQCLKYTDKVCCDMIRERCFNQSSHDNTKVIHENSESNLDSEEQLFSKKFKNNKIIERKNSMQEENRVVYTIKEHDTDLVKPVKLFQKLLRGRAYQTMIIMAKIRFKPFLQSAESAVIQKSVHAIPSDKKNNEIQDDLLELSTKRYVSRFFDTLSKESVRLYEESKNAKLVELGEKTRTMREAYEGYRRWAEQLGRMEQDEILKQVLKIHQDVSELFSEDVMKDAIELCAKEEGLKLIRETTSKKIFRKDKFYSTNCKTVENELVLNTIIPEAYKIIHREYTN